MRKYIDLIEALNTVIPYEWREADAVQNMKKLDWAIFTVNGKRVQVDFFTKDETAHVVFSVDANEQITGEGDAFTILGTVIHIIQDFLSNYPEITQLAFDATVIEPSRGKLYRALIKHLAADGWEASEHPIENGQTTQFRLTRVGAD